MTQAEIRYTFLEVRAVDADNNVCNEIFFLGRLPQVGQVVEMVFVGNEENGAMRFQLRTLD